MATVSRQSIPPSLLAGYGAVLTAPRVTAGLTHRIGLKATVRQAQKQPATDPVLQLRRDAAKWLVEHWQPGNPSSFYAARLAEIRGFNFNAAYWHTLTPTRDRTEYGVPVIKAYERPVNGRYADPLRIQTNCVYDHWSKFYNTPVGDGTALEPAPGWEGCVIDGMWRDLWFAQRRLTFFLPVTLSYTSDRPVLIVINSQVKATASFRVNKSWYARGCWPYFFRETSGELPPVNYLLTQWKNTDVYPLTLVSENEQSWQCTNSLTLLRDSGGQKAFQTTQPCNRFGVVIITPPSRGVYFARNDAVNVSHHETVTVYVGKVPS
ncbi:MAG: hypothetical protein ACXW1W_02755 [Methylococcaceae bacterium]